MATNYSAFLPEVRPEVPGCGESVIIRAIREAAIRLCKESLLVREELAAINVVQGTDVYALTPIDANDRVITANYVLYDSTPLNAKTSEELDHLDYGWRTADEGAPGYYFLPVPNQIRLNRKPNIAITGGLIVGVSTRPTETSTTCNDILFDDWFIAIGCGAKGKLLNMRDKAWYDANKAKRETDAFDAYILQAKARVTSGYTRKPAAVKMRKFV